MIQHVVKYVCDFCRKRHIVGSRDEVLPPRWSSLSGFYGEVAHACGSCREKAKAVAREEGLRIWPEKMKEPKR